MVTFQYQVKDPVGLHARPAGQLVKFVKGCKSSVSIQKSEKKVDATRLLAVMGLAVKQNDIVVFTLEGDSENEDCKALEAFCEKNL